MNINLLFHRNEIKRSTRKILTAFDMKCTPIYLSGNLSHRHSYTPQLLSVFFR